MNGKTLKKVLKKKHQDFIASIEDETVRKLVAENSIITGGAIASGLLNEKINDFDYYFTNYDTCLAVAQYYTERFVKAHPDKKILPEVCVTPGLNGEPQRVKIKIQSQGVVSETDVKSPYEYFETRPQDEGAEFVDEITEIISERDAISQGDDVPAEVLDEMGKSKEKYRPIFMTSNAITLSNDVQLIMRFYGDPEAIHKNYDFIHCTNYWLSKDLSLHLNQPALESLLSRTLYYVGSKYPVCSVIRTRKFIRRKWHINAGQYIKMLFQVSQLDLTDIDTLEDQLTGVDNAYFYQVIEYFKEQKEKDPNFKIEQTYVVSIIDKIFG